MNSYNARSLFEPQLELVFDAFQSAEGEPRLAIELFGRFERRSFLARLFTRHERDRLVISPEKMVELRDYLNKALAENKSASPAQFQAEAPSPATQQYWSSLVTKISPGYEDVTTTHPIWSHLTRPVVVDETP